MSPVFGGRSAHDRARDLAAERLDEVLARADAAWLEEHLAGCPACAGTAAAYEADRAALRGLRAVTPEPPRDLWARTAATIEVEGAAAARRPARSRLGIPAVTLAPLAGLAVVAVAVGAGLFNGQPAVPGEGPGATPIALAGGNVAVLSQGAGGGLEIKTGRLHELCPMSAPECRVEPSFEIAQVPDFGSADDVEARISPARDRMVVINRDASGTGGVFVVPVTTPTPEGSPATSAPTVVATETPVVTEAPSAAPTDAATPSPTDGTPSETPASSEAPVSSAPPSDVPPSEAPSSPAATETPTEAPTTEPTEAPTSTPVVVVTPRPDGALEIASGVVVVDGPATYNPDGTRFAFTARPEDGTGGPNVYVWDTDELVARAITDDDRSVFATWDGRDVLVSRVVDEMPSTLRLDAATGEPTGERSRSAWLPTLAPDGTHAVWWDGTVRLAEDGVTWVPDEGRLVLGAWPEGAGEMQALADDVASWQAGWDHEGKALAVWTAAGGRDTGRLSLFPVDPATGVADLVSPMLEDEPALGAFTLEPGMLAWSAPGKEGRRTVQVLGWKGDTIGRGELPAEGGATLVQ